MISSTILSDVDSENDEEKTIDIDQDCSTGGSSYEDEGMSGIRRMHRTF